MDCFCRRMLIGFSTGALLVLAMMEHYLYPRSSIRRYWNNGVSRRRTRSDCLSPNNVRTLSIIGPRGSRSNSIDQCSSSPRSGLAFTLSRICGISSMNAAAASRVADRSFSRTSGVKSEAHGAGHLKSSKM